MIFRELWREVATLRDLVEEQWHPLSTVRHVFTRVDVKVQEVDGMLLIVRPKTRKGAEKGDEIPFRIAGNDIWVRGERFKGDGREWDGNWVCFNKNDQRALIGKLLAFVSEFFEPDGKLSKTAASEQQPSGRQRVRLSGEERAS